MKNWMVLLIVVLVVGALVWWDISKREVTVNGGDYIFIITPLVDKCLVEEVIGGDYIIYSAKRKLSLAFLQMLREFDYIEFVHHGATKERGDAHFSVQLNPCYDERTSQLALRGILKAELGCR